MDRGAALRDALTAWRRTLSPVVADAVVVLDRELAYDARLPNRREDFQRAWIALAEGAADEAVGYLCRTLTRCLDGPATLHDRVARLARRPADPRVAAALTEIVVRGAFDAWRLEEVRAVYAPLLALIAVSGDIRQLEPLREAQRNPRSRSGTVRQFLALDLPVCIERLAGTAPSTPPEDELTTWRRVTSAHAPVDAPSGARLLSDVLDHPSDDGPRHVYADWLQAQGDPRGELIQLQLSEPSEETDKRVRALLRKHKADWLGPDLSCVLTQVRFARGFLDSAELAQNSVADESLWLRAAKDPALATVTRLGLGRSNLRHYAAFVEGGALLALDTLDVPGPPFLKKLLATPVRERLRRLDLHKLPSDKDLARLVIGFPRLEVLTVRLDFVTDEEGQRTLAALARSGVLPRLRAVGILGLPHATALCARWAELPANVERLLFGWQAQNELRRKPSGELVLRVVVEGGWSLAFLDPLPPLTTVELVGGTDFDAEQLLSEAVARGLSVRRVGDASPP